MSWPGLLWPFLAVVAIGGVISQMDDHFQINKPVARRGKLRTFTSE